MSSEVRGHFCEFWMAWECQSASAPHWLTKRPPCPLSASTASGALIWAAVTAITAIIITNKPEILFHYDFCWCEDFGRAFFSKKFYSNASQERTIFQIGIVRSCSENSFPSLELCISEQFRSSNSFFLNSGTFSFVNFGLTSGVRLVLFH